MAVIKNFNSLATSRLRRDLLKIIEAGYESINVASLMSKSVLYHDGILKLNQQSYDLTKFNDVYIVGIGKGSAAACLQLEKVLGKRIKKGYAIDITARQSKKIKVFVGTHPLPSKKNARATEKIVNLLAAAKDSDLILAVICGGGSSLFCRPAGLSCTDLQAIFDHLLKSGASIQQINTVRKHLSLIHGGYFAKYAYPATVATLVISDVPGDDLNFVASGPTVLDKTTKVEAKKIADRFGLRQLPFIETPKQQKYFENVSNLMIANGSVVVEAMAMRATKLGYKLRIYSTKVTGLAKEVGPTMAKAIRPGEALLACGETQVHVKRRGRGGRNQDLVLSAAAFLPTHSAIASAASDGKDNIPVAGAVIDNPSSVARLARKKIDPVAAVELNTSYKVLKYLKAHIFINKTTANISDFMAVIRAPS